MADALEEAVSRAKLPAESQDTVTGATASVTSDPNRLVTRAPDLTISHLDFSCGAPRLSPSRKDDIVVIDGFWADPWCLRAAALSAPFESQLSASGFAFQEWRSSQSHTRRMAE